MNNIIIILSTIVFFISLLLHGKSISPSHIRFIRFCSLGSLGSKSEARLLRKLFENYDKKERPAKIDTDPVNVGFLVFLRQIIDVEEKLQILQSNLWLSLGWFDYRLRWNPAEFSNITRVIGKFLFSLKAFS